MTLDEGYGESWVKSNRQGTQRNSKVGDSEISRSTSTAATVRRWELYLVSYTGRTPRIHFARRAEALPFLHTGRPIKSNRHRPIMETAIEMMRASGSYTGFLPTWRSPGAHPTRLLTPHFAVLYASHHSAYYGLCTAAMWFRLQSRERRCFMNSHPQTALVNKKRIWNPNNGRSFPARHFMAARAA